jgi:hypothetical protein
VCAGPFVYRLGRHPFTVQRGVRLPYGLCAEERGGTVERRRAQATDAVNGRCNAGATQVQGRCWGRSSAWLEHSTVTREVAGSSPVAPVLDSSQWHWQRGELGGLSSLLMLMN